MAKKLYRSVSDRKIAGVCGGLGEYLNIDPTIIRLVAAVSLLAWLSGGIAYLIAWMVIPENRQKTDKKAAAESQ